MDIPSAEYKGAKYTFQPMLRMIFIDTPCGQTVGMPLPPYKMLQGIWGQVVEPLKDFYRQIYGDIHEAH